MAFQKVLEAIELLSYCVSGQEVAEYLKKKGICDVQVKKVQGQNGYTDYLRISISGIHGKSSGGTVPTLGIVGRLGGLGIRPHRMGLVSDADGAIVAIASALKIAAMCSKGDILPGDVIISTHICSNASIQPKEPVPFMKSPVDMDDIRELEVALEMDAILSVDTSKGNFLLNQKGMAITSTVLQGYILPVSNHLLTLAASVTGKLPMVLPLNQYDISPYNNGLTHINSILQPAVIADCPVVGVALAAQSTVPGCAIGANYESDLRDAVAFCIEVAQDMPKGQDIFYDTEQYQRAITLYGTLKCFQKSRI